LLLLLETLDPLLGGVLLLFVELIAPNGGAKDEGEVLIENPVDSAGKGCLGIKEIELIWRHRGTVIVHADGL
jgi:hypothetical protein